MLRDLDWIASPGVFGLTSVKILALWVDILELVKGRFCECNDLLF